MALPPLIFESKNSGHDKRITTVLQTYWEYLKEDRPFPTEGEIVPQNIEKIWNNCFIVGANNSSKKEDYSYKYIGENIIEAYGEDLTGLNIDAMAAPQASHLAEEYEKVLANKRPVFDEGEITNNGKCVKYRQILLPLGDDGINITAIIGGMSYKIF